MRRLLAVVMLLAAACSTTGRELPAPTRSTLPSVEAVQPANRSEGVTGFALSSEDFAPGGALPADVGAHTGNVAPALEWAGVPSRAIELAIVAADGRDGRVYWALTGIDPATGSSPGGGAPAGAQVLRNSFGVASWTGPTAAAGEKVPVVFTLYALDARPNVPADASDRQTVELISAASFTKSTLTGWFLGDGASLGAG